MKKRLSIILFILVLIAGCAEQAAQSQRTSPAPQQPQAAPTGSQTPPPEAAAACAGKSEGTSCSFTAPDRTVTGTCRNTPEGVACVPR